MQPGRKCVPSNPLAGLERRGGKEKKRDRVLNDDEIRTLWWGLDRDGMPAERHVCVAIRMILTTMVRPYQAAGAQICELADLGRHELHRRALHGFGNRVGVIEVVLPTLAKGRTYLAGINLAS